MLCAVCMLHAYGTLAAPLLLFFFFFPLFCCCRCRRWPYDDASVLQFGAPEVGLPEVFQMRDGMVYSEVMHGYLTCSGQGPEVSAGVYGDGVDGVVVVVVVGVGVGSWLLVLVLVVLMVVVLVLMVLVVVGAGVAVGGGSGGSGSSGVGVVVVVGVGSSTGSRGAHQQ